MKHIRHFVFAALLLLVAPMWAFEVDGIYYRITSNVEPYEVQVTYSYSSHYSGDVVVPESVEYEGIVYSVTSIGLNAFNNSSGGNSGLTSVFIPNSVLSIGGGAFYKCDGLTSVTLGNSVTSIGWSAFYGCTKLSSIDIPNSVTIIEREAFKGCVELTSVSLGNSLEKIEYWAFEECTSLTSVHLPNSLTSIESSAFEDCTSLTSVTIGNSLEDISYSAFFNCPSLASITVASGNRKLDSRDNCNAIIETETNTLLVGCKNTIIPNSVTSIRSGAFWGSGLTSLVIPNSVTDIGSQAFVYCSDLTSILVASGNPVFDSRNNCNAVIESETNTLLVGCKNTIIPNSVTIIGGAAFQGCTGLTTLSSFNIPNSVTTIGGHAFWGCMGLTSIIIPNYIDSIGSRAFGDNPGLTSITVELGNPRYDSRNNCNAIIETETNSLRIGCKNTVIPNSVTSIGDCAFHGSTDMTSVTIPKSVTSIAYGAFSGCTGLSSVIIKATIPPTVPTNNVVFEYITGQNALLYVPCGCKDAYANSEGYCWREWNTSLIIDTGFLYDFEVMSNDENYGSVHILQQPDCESNVATVKAEPIGEYLFVHWSANGQVVSLDNPYTFVVDDDVKLVAHFSGMGVDEEFAQSITIAPNPTQSIVNIECESMRNITLCTLDGRVTRTCEVNDDACTLDMTGMSKGIYVLRVETNDSAVINRKIIKE